MELDNEQQQVVDYILNQGSCYVVGPPGTGKTEIFNAVGETLPKEAAFLPFTRAARAELTDRLPHSEIEIDDEVVRIPSSGIEVATINSYCQQHLGIWPGSYLKQLEGFLDKKEKPQYNLVGIDEVQDLRPIHFDIVKSIMKGRLFAGGDPNQTIFTFGDALGYQIFKDLDDMGCKKFELHNDYRSGPEVVSILNTLIRGHIVSKGPRTYNRTAVFARSHVQLEGVSFCLERQKTPHTIRLKSGKDKKVLGGGNLFLMVTHACKGLGFDKVFQLDWVLPNKPDTNYQEETNLMYVSVARASKEFYLVDGNYRTHCWDKLRNTVAKQLGLREMLSIVNKEVVCV